MVCAVTHQAWDGMQGRKISVRGKNGKEYRGNFWFVPGNPCGARRAYGISSLNCPGAATWIIPPQTQLSVEMLSRDG